MLGKDSRYGLLTPVETRMADGRSLVLLPIRRLSTPLSTLDHQVLGHDRLDLLAHKLFNNPLYAYAISDANSELDAEQLLAEPGSILQLPERK